LQRHGHDISALIHHCVGVAVALEGFTLNPEKREAVNFYVWDSEEAAKAFFTDALVERVTGLYGVRPDVEFVQIATLVENAD